MYYVSKPAAADKPARRIETAACFTLVGSAIAFGVCRFWNIEVPAAPMLTPALAALSALLATVAVRIEEAARKRAWLTLGLAVALAAVCLVFEAAMTHMGLEWLNEREGIAPAWALWPASVGLSLFNAAAGFVFLREIPEPAPRPAVEAAPRRLPPPAAERPWHTPELRDMAAAIDRRVAELKAAAH